jgi:PAS domain S-box-containing protein
LALRWKAGQQREGPAREPHVKAEETERGPVIEPTEEASFRLLADAAPVMIWLTDRNALCEYFNRPWLEFRGRSIEEELGAGWTQGVHAADRERFLRAFAVAYRQRASFREEHRLRRSDGEYRWVLHTGVPRHSPDGAFMGYVGWVIDVTDDVARRRLVDEQKRQLEAVHVQLEATMAELERRPLEPKAAARLESDFAALMNHELRTPLNVIFGYTELLAAGLGGKLDPRGSEFVESIRSSAATLQMLIEELLAFARLNAGDERLVIGPCDATQLLRQAADLVRPIAVSKGLSFEVDGTGSAVPLRTDATKVKQVLGNILNNAVKFTEHGGVRAMVAPQVDGFIEFVVLDTGPGIPHDQFERIFQPFTQLAPPMTRRTSGLGLGLAIGRRMARLLGGDLVAHSELGAGTRLVLRLPSTPPLEAQSQPLA